MAASKKRPIRHNGEGEPAYSGVPNVALILKRMRERRGLSIRDVAAGSGLSPSFLSAVERGESDVSIGSLAQIAKFFDHDLGSMLGYSTRLARPTFVDKTSRRLVDRGPGVRYELMQVPGMNMEFVTAKFAPRSGFRDELTHEGVDALYVISGELVLRVNHIDYPVRADQCVVYSAAYPHLLRNDSTRQAFALGITTAQM